MKFSIVIPAYNADRFIERCINSILRQTFNDYEMIVVNDGSKDNTLNVLSSIKDHRLKVINQENAGVSVARNNGILNAEGDYICFLDADDEYYDNHLESLNWLITKYQKEFYSTRFCLELMDGKIVFDKRTGADYFLDNPVDAIIKESELVWTGCVCAKREVFFKFGLFEKGVKLAEDTDMWKRIYVHTGLVCLDKNTVKRNRDGSEATKYYTRSYEVDKLNRYQMFMSDSDISDSVKHSLTIEHELSKIEVTRSFLIDGDKKKARVMLRSVNKSFVPLKKWWITRCCFIIPNKVLRAIIKYKYSTMYKW